MAQKGDTVLYVPDDCHALECDSRGEYLFHFVYADGPKAGQEVPAAEIGSARRPPGGGPLRLNRGSGLTIRPTAPKYFWPAVIDEAGKDGTATLSVKHPFGGVLLVYGGVRHSAKKEANTWHTAGE